MTGMKTYDIVVRLNDINELFTLPPQDVFADQVRFVPGIEVIRSQVKPHMLKHDNRSRIVMVLPKKYDEPDLVTKLKNAISCYCHFKIWQNHDVAATLKNDSLRALVIGTLFMALGLFILGYLDILPAFISTFLNDGFNVAFWVILWRPVDFLLFDLTASMRETRIYKYIARMDIVVHFE
ncbi:hypothetical protein KDW_34000 [Dictyobacter vulcani]|uniref:Uncharacterized protein n=1 Tax=Dictyobacter vulcani TaxID=2607529 RepID=A0A5J4KHL6_9CHLR|nr:hypothetical protein [Dictyobacter vulcani]GER89238.1 hypothetical protein KDW_34000 [Dictyobacter vulcani]